MYQCVLAEYVKAVGGEDTFLTPACVEVLRALQEVASGPAIQEPEPTEPKPALPDQPPTPASWEDNCQADMQACSENTGNVQEVCLATAVCAYYTKHATRHEGETGKGVLCCGSFASS